MKKRVLAALLCAAVSVSAAGCSNGESTPAASNYREPVAAGG